MAYRLMSQVVGKAPSGCPNRMCQPKALDKPSQLPERSRKRLMSKTVQKGRDAKTGRFISIEEANRRPSTTVVEKVKVGPTKHRNK